MIRWLQRWWWRRQREFDLRVLWPECKRQSIDLDHARAAFALHAFQDPAWVREYEYNLIKVIGELK